MMATRSEIMVEEATSPSLLDATATLIWNETVVRNVSSLPNFPGLGPIREPLSTVIPMTLVYTVILVTGMVGNICTCVVITRNKYMHTATNYYLFSLAISDLLLLVLGLPQEIYQLWRRYPYVFGEAFCIIRGLTSETSTNASVLTITAFTVERYLAICHPLRAHTMSKLSRAVKFIIFIWLSSALCAVPLALQFGVVLEEINVPESLSCTLKTQFDHAFEVSTFLFFIIPMTIISVLYMLIGVQLRKPASNLSQKGPHPLLKSNGFHESHQHQSRHHHHHNGGMSFKSMKHWSMKSDKSRMSTNSSRSNSNLSSRRAVIKMLFAVVVAFFICWAPFHAQRLMAIYVTEPTEAEVIIFKALTYISGVTYYVSATINPILYSIMSLKFRQAFKETLSHCCGSKRPLNEWIFRGDYISYHQPASIKSQTLPV